MVCMVDQQRLIDIDSLAWQDQLLPPVTSTTLAAQHDTNDSTIPTQTPPYSRHPIILAQG